MKKYLSYILAVALIFAVSGCINRPLPDEEESKNTADGSPSAETSVEEDASTKEATATEDTAPADAQQSAPAKTESAATKTEESTVSNGDNQQTAAAQYDQSTAEVKEDEPALPPASAVRSFSMTAKMWDFAPATITVKKDDIVKLSITSIDVTHGFSLPDFGVQAGLNPSETVNVEFTADKAGTFSFFCSVFCGDGHSQMAGTLIVTE